MAGSPEEIHKHQKVYLLIGITLLFFTVVTVVVSRFDVGDPGVGPSDITIGLIIASFKSSLVALVFMHLNSEKGLIYKTLLFTVIFFGAMMALFVLAHGDPIAFDFYP